MSENPQDLKSRTREFALRVIRMYSILSKNDTVAQIVNLSVSPGIVASRGDSAGWWVRGEIVAQISNLLCRRLPVGRPFDGRSGGGLEIRDTAGWKPALLWLRLRPRCAVSPTENRRAAKSS